MYLLIIAWVYVVVMMAVSEAASSQGTVLGAFITLVMYGALPLSIVLYLMRTPARRARRRTAEAAAETKEAAGETARPAASAEAPDRGGLAAGDAIAPEGKEP